MKKFLLLFVFLSVSLVSYPKTLMLPKSRTLDAGDVTLSSYNKKPFTGMVTDGRDREFYKDGKPDGKWLCFYDNKRVKSIENWKKGSLDGKYILYSRNGKKLLETYYKNGELNGKYRIYYESGKPRILGKIKNGVPVGKWKRYSDEQL